MEYNNYNIILIFDIDTLYIIYGLERNKHKKCI